jgi:C-terminal processing protease CtpA/Prc
MPIRILTTLFGLAVVLLGLASAPAQQKKPPELVVDAKMRAQVIDGALTNLNDAYVFPEVARKMEEAIRARAAKGEYDKITTAAELCEVLTSHLREVSSDKHLRVTFSAKPVPAPQTKPAEIKPEDRDKAREAARKNAALTNFGFEKCERLRGNIGYLDMRGFVAPELGGDTAAACMGFLGNTDALIVDMRKNGGGSPAMVAVMCSYFFEAGQLTHLNDIYTRKTDSTRQFWTLPYLAGKRYVNKDVFILTSKQTFSAAEEFTYNMKNLKRATIVGETTGGGAHPTGNVRINEHFMISVPFARSINPVTKTNWEGTGIAPDIECPAEQALLVGQLTALKRLAEKTTDPQWLAQLKSIITLTEQGLEQLKKK